MADVIIIGDGPGALSAALFLGKRGKDVVVLGQDNTAMNWAYLYNYLGIEAMSGTELQRIGKKQAAAHGARLLEVKAVEVKRTGTTFSVKTEDGHVHEGRYLILSEGKSPKLGPTLGLATGEANTIQVDRDGRTSMENVYAIGRAVRAKRAQAIISAGEGAAAALDILSKEAKEDVWDWDEPPKS